MTYNIKVIYNDGYSYTHSGKTYAEMQQILQDLDSETNYRMYGFSVPAEVVVYDDRGYLVTRQFLLW